MVGMSSGPLSLGCRHFASENVRYLELRTTPRALADADAGATCGARGLRRARTAAAAAGRGARRRPRPRLVPRLLLSADRSAGAAAARDRAPRAAALRARDAHGGATYLVGVDFSGNPTKGSFAACAAAFGEARAAGLPRRRARRRVDDADDTTAVLDRRRPPRPRAAAHARARAAIRGARAPVEICPTSNCKTLGLGKRVGLRAHPTLRFWLDAGHPISINTDDAGVFATSASHELARVVLEAYPLGFMRAEAVVALSAAPLDHAFEPADSGTMRAIRAEFAAEGAAALARYHGEIRGGGDRDMGVALLPRNRIKGPDAPARARTEFARRRGILHCTETFDERSGSGTEEKGTFVYGFKIPLERSSRAPVRGALEDAARASSLSRSW